MEFCLRRRFSFIASLKRINWTCSHAYYSAPRTAHCTSNNLNFHLGLTAVNSAGLLSLPNASTSQTDHNALKQLQNQPKLSSTQAGWIEHLHEFDITIEYLPSLQNHIPEFLSLNAVSTPRGPKCLRLKYRKLRRKGQLHDYSVLSEKSQLEVVLYSGL
jgi:hypothetical protein